MRLGPRLGPVSTTLLSNGITSQSGTGDGGEPGGSTTEPPRIVPDGLIPTDAAQFDVMDDWTLDPTVSDVGGAVTFTPGTTAKVEYVVNAPAGDLWLAYTLSNGTAGNIGAQLGGSFQNSPFSSRVSAQHVARFASNGHTRVRLSSNATYDGTVEDFQAVDMTALLAQPSDIYIAAGQSLMAAESQSGPVDPEKDYWLPRCLYWPGSTNNTYGIDAGVLAAASGPLQMTSPSSGVSPALSFARRILDTTPAARTVIIVACASGGTRLIGDDAEWNPNGTVGNGGARYADMVSMTLAALARNPQNRVRGLLWAQGESDRSLVMDQTYPAAFETMLTQLRTDISEAALPVILIGPMPDDTSNAQPVFIQTQERLDQDSGHSTALQRVHYVARPTGYLSADGTHPEAEGNRIAGLLAANRYIAEGY